jgi:hypothetical protein
MYCNFVAIDGVIKNQLEFLSLLGIEPWFIHHSDHSLAAILVPWTSESKIICIIIFDHNMTIPVLWFVIMQRIYKLRNIILSKSTTGVTEGYQENQWNDRLMIWITILKFNL